MTNIDSTTLADLETQIEKLSAEENRLRAAVKRLFPDIEAKVEKVKDAKVDVFGEEPTLTTPGGVRQQVDTIPFKRELARRYANTIRLFEKHIA